MLPNWILNGKTIDLLYVLNKFLQMKIWIVHFGQTKQVNYSEVRYSDPHWKVYC